MITLNWEKYLFNKFFIPADTIKIKFGIQGKKKLFMRATIEGPEK